MSWSSPSYANQKFNPLLRITWFDFRSSWESVSIGVESCLVVSTHAAGFSTALTWLLVWDMIGSSKIWWKKFLECDKIFVGRLKIQSVAPPTKASMDNEIRLSNPQGARAMSFAQVKRIYRLNYPKVTTKRTPTRDPCMSYRLNMSVLVTMLARQYFRTEAQKRETMRNLYYSKCIYSL